MPKQTCPSDEVQEMTVLDMPGHLYVLQYQIRSSDGTVVQVNCDTTMHYHQSILDEDSNEVYNYIR